MKITIKEVAKAAGVSTSTVSRVISDNKRISDETKKLVRKTMKDLGYHPNAIARSLVNRSTKTIGIVMPQSTERAFLNPFFPEALSGISAAAHESEYCLLLSTGSSEEEQRESIEGIIRSGRVDGVIIMYSSVDDTILDEVKSMDIPAVIMGKPLSSRDILYVDNDNVEAAFNVTEKLINKKHDNIALICGPFKYIVSLDRLDGYRNALLKYNKAFDRRYIEEGEFTKECGYNAMIKLLELEERPTAIVITDDVMAFGALEAIKEHRLNVPNDIEIISFNNIPLAQFSSPGITSVDINSYSLGYEAAKLIIENIQGISEKNKYIVPTKIVYRESSKE